VGRRTEPSFDKAEKRKVAPTRGKAKRGKKAAKSARKRRGLIGFTFYWGTVLGLWGGIAVAGIFAFYAVQLPSASTWVVPDRAPDMRILAANGTQLANRGMTGGKALRLEAMSPHIPNAVIAIEDRRFHTHFGFDPIGFGRAVAINVTTGARQGGSTLTQQLAKNLFLTPERSYGRKVQELILAFWLEANYSKAEILEMYLNRVYFGAGATGVDAAARRYFGKSAADVTPAEAALLAGLLKAPSALSPARNPQKAKARAKVVLTAMRREGFPTTDDIDTPTMRAAAFARYGRTGPQQYAADMVAKRVEELVGKVDDDLVVTTTLDPLLLDAAQAEIQAALASKGKTHSVGQGALVSITPKGAVRALVGGSDYAGSQFNRALAKRQPGSAFKPVVWLSAFERGAVADDIRVDEPVRYGNWAPVNYDREFRGEVTLREAFARSLNTVSAKLTMEAGPKVITRTAALLGADAKLAPHPSIALGTGEMTLVDLARLYAPFANGGRRIEPYLISEVRTGNGKVLYRRKASDGEPVITSRALTEMNDVLATAIQFGTGKNASLGSRPAGGKTGTTQGLRDALFVGYTADLVTAVWFGNDDNSPMKKVTGATLPAIAWRGFMTTAHIEKEMSPIPGAAEVVALPISIPRPTFRPQSRVASSRPAPSANVQPRIEEVPQRNELRERMTRIVMEQGAKVVQRSTRRALIEFLKREEQSGG
jgi:penicillin-binding protein 1A